LSDPKTIALLTGGGDAPGLNAVIRAVAKAALAKGWSVLGIEDGFEGLLRDDGVRPLTLPDVRGILQTGGTILRCSNRGDPFSSPIVGSRESADRSADVLTTVSKLQLDALVVIGGDGSLGIAHRLAKLGVSVVGIPKTIDNDVGGTDVTFGFDTACQTAMEAIDRLHTTAASHQRVMVIEVMGRDAGWIALRAGTSGGGDVILIPEMPFDIEAVCHKIRERREGGSRFSIVVVAEGASPKGGGKTVVVGPADSATGVERLGGVGAAVARAIEDRTGIECRVTVLGHVQRGGSPTSWDRVLGTRLGVGAVLCVERGLSGVMVGLRGDRILETPLEDAIRDPHRVDPEGDEVQAIEATGVSFGR
jgi:6-phosphofructokinase 1